MFKSAPPLAAATALDVSAGSPVVPMEDGPLSIEFCVKFGKGATETYNAIQHMYSDEALSRARVFEWHRRFREGWRQQKMLRHLAVRAPRTFREHLEVAKYFATKSSN